MQIIFKNKRHNLENLLQVLNDCLDLTATSSGSVEDAEGSVARQHVSPSLEPLPTYWELMNCHISVLELLSPSSRFTFNIKISPSIVYPLHEGGGERNSFPVQEQFGVFS